MNKVLVPKTLRQIFYRDLASMINFLIRKNASKIFSLKELVCNTHLLNCNTHLLVGTLRIRELSFFQDISYNYLTYFLKGSGIGDSEAKIFYKDLAFKTNFLIRKNASKNFSLKDQVCNTHLLFRTLRLS